MSLLLQDQESMSEKQRGMGGRSEYDLRGAGLLKNDDLEGAAWDTISVLLLYLFICIVCQAM